MCTSTSPQRYCKRTPTGARRISHSGDSDTNAPRPASSACHAREKNTGPRASAEGRGVLDRVLAPTPSPACSADHRDAPVQRYKHPVVSRRRELGACPTSSCTCIVPLAGILAPSLTASPHQLARPYRRGQIGRVPPRCQGFRQVSPLPIRMFLLPGSPTAAGHGNPPPSASGAWR